MPQGQDMALRLHCYMEAAIMAEISGTESDLSRGPQMSFDEFCGFYRLAWERAGFERFCRQHGDGIEVALPERDWAELLAWYDWLRQPQPTAGKEKNGKQW